MRQFKNIKEFLETCSEDEQEYIYDLYYSASVDELVDMLFEYMPADDTIQEIKDYRREVAEEAE
jgi:hypothetical protein